ncbi:hypothetical protein L6255_03880 [Candidatus Parcubacteria bacterium]|nr:hypothetical protein [Patescibacteria group bacterium]MCG2689552.1 hypothetical protein [Candidatus Parcubacteria bacterium]
MIVLYLILIGTIVAYLLTKTLLAISFLGLLPIVFLVFRASKTFKFRIVVTLKKATVATLMVFLILSNFWAFIFSIGNKIPFNPVGFNESLLVALIIGVLITGGMYLVAFLLGTMVKGVGLIEKTVVGFCFLSLLFLVLASFKIFYIPLITLIFIIPIILQRKLLHQLVINIKSTLSHQWVFSGNNAIYFIILVLFGGILLTQSLKGFVEGPDGLRAYLNLTKFIAQNFRVPSPGAFVGIPFPFELLSALPFKLGGIPVAKFFANSFYLVLLLELIACVKLLGIRKNAFPIIFALACHPILYYFLSVEFKTDIFVLVVMLGALLSFFRKSPGTLFLLVFAVVAKFSAIFFALPLGLFYLATIFKTHPRKKLITSLAFSTIPLLFWLVFYRASYPFVGQFGLYGSNYSYDTSLTDTCHREIEAYETTKFYEAKKGFLGIVTLPFAKLFVVSGRGAITSLNDPGVLYFLLLLPLIYLYVKNRPKVPPVIKWDNPVTAIFLSTFISFILWASVRSDAIWYNLAGFILLILFLYKGVERVATEKQFNVIVKFVGFISVLHLLTYIFVDPFATYIPTNVNAQTLYGGAILKEARQRSYDDIYQIEKATNLDRRKILFSSGIAFVRLNYFVDNSAERVVYFDGLDTGKLKIEDFGWGVYFKYPDSLKIPCVTATQQKAKKLFESAGAVIVDNPSATVYRFIGFQP